MAVVEPAPWQAPPPVRRGGRRRLLPALLLVLALVVAIVVWFLAGKRYRDAVADLAPAPVGCDTTLDFEHTGTYTFFVETKGHVADIDGDCGADDRNFSYDGDALPRVSITLRDDNGDEVDLDRVDSPHYDQGGNRGEAIRTARIDDAGEYTLTVDANENDVLVRIGRDPQSGVTAMRVGAFVALLVALAAAAWLLLASRKPAAPAAGPGAPPWRPMSGQPPPVAPPYAQPSPNPPYAWPPGPGAQPPGAAPAPPPAPGWGPGSGRPLPPPRP